MTGRVVGTIKHVRGHVDGQATTAWAITADPDVVIRIKRILPSIRTSRSETLYVSDTDQLCRELEWITSRWNFGMSDEDRQYLHERADDDQEREQLVANIIAGTATVTTNPDWLTPQVPLRGYQRIAADLVKASGVLLIGDELGGGKTAMSLAVLEDPAARPALAVIKSGLGLQWLRELRKFYPQLSGYEIKTKNAEVEFPKLCGPDGKIAHDLILVTYAKLASWRYHLAGKVRSVIFDEIQELRRPESQKYEAASHINREAVVRVGLSATPVYNYGGEIFAIMDSLDRGCLGHRDEFLREWCGGTSPSADAGTMAKVSVDNPEGLKAHLEGRGMYLRRSLEEMGIDIPGAMTIDQVVPSDTAMFEKLSGDAIEMAKLILSQDASSSEKWRTASELDWRMRQATGIAKAPFVADFMKMALASEEKVLLFGWHRRVYDIWMESLSQFDPVMYTGTESSAGKANSLRQFIHGDSRVLIMSLRSGAGVDGLQQVVSTLAFGELDWSPGVHRQCIGRLNRIGQTKKVRAYFLTSTEGSDPVMLDTLNIKAMESRRLTGATDLLGGKPAGSEASRSQSRQLALAVLRRAGHPVPDDADLVDKASA